MAIYITLLDPDIIVIGGSVSNIDLLYNEETHSKISQFVFNKKLKTPIVPSMLGKNAIVLGAALLCQRA
jgi:fructokinase